MKNQSNLPTLKVVDRQLDKDKQDRPYARLTIETPSFIMQDGIKIKYEAKKSKFNAWENNYLDQQDFGWELEKGDTFIGKFVTRAVEPYEIDGRQCHTYTAVVRPLAGQTDVNEIAIMRAFAKADKVLIDDTSSVETVAEETAVEPNAVNG